QRPRRWWLASPATPRSRSTAHPYSPTATSGGIWPDAAGWRTTSWPCRRAASAAPDDTRVEWLYRARVSYEVVYHASERSMRRSVRATTLTTRKTDPPVTRRPRALLGPTPRHWRTQAPTS